MTRNRVALVSGASRGIGAATARELARQGWRLSLGMRDPRLPEWADPASVHIHAYDAAGADLETGWVTAATARFGRIDAIVASAGICSTSTVIEADDDELNRLLEIHCKAPRRLAKAAWNALTASGRGRVIILGSLSGKRVKHAGSGLYSMTKFAAVALAHGIRHAGFDVGIRATAVCPGLVDTDMARALEARAPADMTDPADLARIIAMLVDLPNEASVAEFTLNCQLEEFY
ncbi:SDR family NAD(P)-dependent oxidoreductase [Mesorhizobium sp. M6A.T.Ce.TU.002.03.1.1]|uniref:SDR family NAD(P)-dependent oxidoreductase n=1 Tax=Mesorhizobium sp. M6A.T.Ce.TU.002.03.1.1 TaxID=2496782 RepID=UPI000FCC9374|nr:SDR family NAD(P)-dependent oxidoreductase [Mesorhizobium sp. M6A.T.Ce.TU.002.03.1.1]RUU43956.1 SDR family NAD(P)-dependent oxidoreductase [Mesorhizobium sp. M6A.T.Ce.TU.002.03.1.1]